MADVSSAAQLAAQAFSKTKDLDVLSVANFSTGLHNAVKVFQALLHQDHQDRGHLKCSLLSSTDEGLLDEALLRRLSACLHDARPRMPPQAIPALLDLFSAGLAAGREAAHRRHKRAADADADAAHPPSETARCAPAHHPPHSPTSSTSSCYSRRSSDSGTGTVGGLLVTPLGPSQRCFGALAPESSELDTAHACHHECPFPVSVDLSAAASQAAASAHWSHAVQPIQPTTLTGCPFLTMVAQQRADTAAVTAAAAAAAAAAATLPLAHPPLAAIRVGRLSSGAPAGAGAPTPPAPAPAAEPVCEDGPAGGAAAACGSAAASGTAAPRPQPQRHEQKAAVLEAVTATPLGCGHHAAPRSQDYSSPEDSRVSRRSTYSAGDHQALPELLEEFPAMSEELYSKLGGWHALVAAVDGFYERIMGDSRFQGAYEHVSARSYLVRKLASFLAFACMGKLPYDARTLWLRHSALIQAFQLMPEDVDLFAKHLRDTLEEVGIHPDVVQMATHMVLQYRHLFNPAITAESFDSGAMGALLAPRGVVVPPKA